MVGLVAFCLSLAIRSTWMSLFYAFTAGSIIVFMQVVETMYLMGLTWSHPITVNIVASGIVRLLVQVLVFWGAGRGLVWFYERVSSSDKKSTLQ